jgi:hypothetical protein
MLMRIGVVMAVNTKITVWQHAMPCQLLAIYQYLRGTYCLYLLGIKVRQQVPLKHRCQHYWTTGNYISEVTRFTTTTTTTTIIYLTANGLSPGGSGYNAST